MKLNDIVRWSFRDVDGLVEYTGVVVALTEDRVELEVEGEGTMGVNLLDGKFVVVGQASKRRKPKGVKPAKPVKGVKTVKSKPVRAKRAPNTKVVAGQSNKELAVTMYRDLMAAHGGHPTRSVVVQAFVAGGFSKNTASTYQHNCKSKWCK